MLASLKMITLLELDGLHFLLFNPLGLFGIRARLFPYIPTRTILD